MEKGNFVLCKIEKYVIYTFLCDTITGYRKQFIGNFTCQKLDISSLLWFASCLRPA